MRASKSLLVGGGSLDEATVGEATVTAAAATMLWQRCRRIGGGSYNELQTSES